ncbi:MAG: oligosaccharide flippase family protein [Nanoarchaeota archaeon]|nr:oligosaccharide flippase family protein [Nanoarchaeota archaeon]
MREKIVSDFKYYFLDMGIVSVIGYLFYIMMGRFLAPIDYGILMTVIGLYTIVSPFTSLGFNETLSRFLPIHGEARTRSYMTYALKKSFIISLAVSAVIFIFSSSIAKYIYANDAMTIPLMVLSLLILAGSISIVLKGVLQGTKNFSALLVSDVISQSLRLILPFILISYGVGVLAGLFGWFATFIVFDITIMIYLIRHFTYKTVKPEKEFINYGLSSAVYAMVLWLLIQNSLLILGFFDIAEAGLFGVALVFGQIILSLPLILIGILLPYLSEMFSRRDISSARRFVELMLKNAFIILFPAVVFITFFSKQIIFHLYSPKYILASKFFFPVLMAFMFLGLSMILMTSLYSYGRHLSRIKYIIISLILSTILSFILYGIYESVGIAYGFLLVQLIMLIYLSIECKRKMQIGFPRKVLNAIPAVVIFSGLIYLVDKYYINFEYGIVFVSVAMLAYLGLLLVFKTFSKDDFDLIKLFLGRK